MARLLKHTLMFALLLALACGCSSEEGAGGEMPANATQVSFILRLSDESEGTRAAWSDGYLNDDGTEYDKRINPDDLKVALYHAGDNAFAANVNIVTYHELASQEEEYEFIGTVETPADTELSAGDYKIMVFANCQMSGSIAANTDLGQLSYTYSADQVKQEEQLIPMWGVTKAHLNLEKGKRDDAGTIDLLRAFAKVEINLHSDIQQSYTIASATLSCYNTQGYSLPKGYADVENTKRLDQEDQPSSSFHPNATAQEADLVFVVPQDGKTATLYIPEYENTPGKEAVINLTLGDGTTGTLHFQPYENGALTGAPYDIVRNHIYRYTVNVEQGELKVQAAVMPWNLVPSSIGWRPQAAPTNENPFDYGTDQYEELVNSGFYILLPRNEFGYTLNGKKRTTVKEVFHDLYEGTKTGDDEPNCCVLYRPRYASGGHLGLNKNSGGATFFFMLTGPKGATWEAHLTNEADFKFATSAPDNTHYFMNCTDKPEDTGKTYDEEGPVSRVTHGIARRKPYVIEINAVHSYTGTSKGGIVDEYPQNLSGKEDWAAYFGDEYLTEWGADKWYGHKVVDTEFYITVRLADGTEYELEINPPYTGDDAPGTNFKDNRRYAGTNTRIWFRQLRAMQDWGYDDLAKDISPTELGNKDERDNFQWWRVNPYWK